MLSTCWRYCWHDGCVYGTTRLAHFEIVLHQTLQSYVSHSWLPSAQEAHVRIVLQTVHLCLLFAQTFFYQVVVWFKMSSWESWYSWGRRVRPRRAYEASMDFFCFLSFWFDVVFYYVGLLDLIYVLVHVGLCCRKPHGGGRTTMEMKTSPGQTGVRAGGGSGSRRRMSRNFGTSSRGRSSRGRSSRGRSRAVGWCHCRSCCCRGPSHCRTRRDRKLHQIPGRDGSSCRWRNLISFYFEASFKNMFGSEGFCLEKSCIQSLLFADLTCLFFIFPHFSHAWLIVMCLINMYFSHSWLPFFCAL